MEYFPTDFGGGTALGLLACATANGLILQVDALSVRHKWTAAVAIVLAPRGIDYIFRHGIRRSWNAMTLDRVFRTQPSLLYLGPNQGSPAGHLPETPDGPVRLLPGEWRPPEVYFPWGRGPRAVQTTALFRLHASFSVAAIFQCTLFGCPVQPLPRCSLALRGGEPTELFVA